MHNAAKLFRELKQGGYTGGSSQLRALVSVWSSEERERTFVRFETGPGEQAQMDWGSWGASKIGQSHAPDLYRPRHVSAGTLKLRFHSSWNVFLARQVPKGFPLERRREGGGAEWRPRPAA